MFHNVKKLKKSDIGTQVDFNCTNDSDMTTGIDSRLRIEIARREAWLDRDRQSLEAEKAKIVEEKRINAEKMERGRNE